jgi:Tfp pilus assembly protein PilF
MRRFILPAVIAWLGGMLGLAGAAPTTRAERMVAQVSSQVGDLLLEAINVNDYPQTDIKRALALYRMVIQADPSNEDAYCTLASWNPSDPRGAEILRAGLEANPESARLNFEYGYWGLLTWSKNPKAAIPYVRKAAALETQRNEKLVYLRTLGHIHHQTGQDQQAKATWNEVLRINPTDAVAQRELAALRASPPGK